MFLISESYLGSDIPYIACTTGFKSCKVDGDFKHGKGKIDINGVIYDKGIVAHAPGRASFSLGGLFDRFSACIGISKLTGDDRCGVTSGDARFRVVGDGEVLQDWEVKSSPEDSKCFEVDITDVDKLYLETDLNDSRECDMSTWAHAKVYKSGNLEFLDIL